MTLHYQTVLFDLDGTLTDPREGITRSIQYALGKLGIDEPDLTQLEHFIGPPLQQAFMQFYDFDEAKAWEAVNFYRERFKVTGLYENRVFDGVMPLFRVLDAAAAAEPVLMWLAWAMTATALAGLPAVASRVPSLLASLLLLVPGAPLLGLSFTILSMLLGS